MNKRRLLKLADMLEADAANKKGIKFNLGLIFEPADANLNPMTEDYEPGLNCGTTACAMGLAALSGKFKRAGLSYKMINDLHSVDIHMTWNGRPVLFGTAARKLFDIKSEDVTFLFTNEGYSTYAPVELKGARGERKVAKQIRKFVENNGEW